MTNNKASKPTLEERCDEYKKGVTEAMNKQPQTVTDKYDIDELIEYTRGELAEAKDSRESAIFDEGLAWVMSGSGEHYTHRVNMLELALATLLDHKAGFVGVPSDADEDMEDYLDQNYCLTDYDYREIIKAAPRSHVAELLGGE